MPKYNLRRTRTETEIEAADGIEANTLAEATAIAEQMAADGVTVVTSTDTTSVSGWLAIETDERGHVKHWDIMPAGRAEFAKAAEFTIDGVRIEHVPKQWVDAEQRVGEMVIAELRRLRLAAEWEDDDIAVPMPGDQVLSIRLDVTSGQWSAALNDGPTLAKLLPIGGAVTSATATEQAGIIIRHVRHVEAMLHIEDAATSAARWLDWSLRERFNGDTPLADEDDPPSGDAATRIALISGARQYVRTWVLANVPGANTTIA